VYYTAERRRSPYALLYDHYTRMPTTRHHRWC